MGRDKYTSKGERRNSSRKTIKMMRRERTFSERITAQLEAFKKDKNVILTVKNPSKSATNKPFIKVPAKDYWRSSKSDK